MSADINNRFGPSNVGRAGATVPAGEVKADFGRSREQAHGQAAAIMEADGVPADRIKMILTELADEVDAGLSKFGDEVEITGDQLDAVISEAYTKVSQKNDELAAAKTKMEETSGFLSAKPGQNTRVGITTADSPTPFYATRRMQNKKAGEKYSDSAPAYSYVASINFSGDQAREYKEVYQQLKDVDEESAIKILNAAADERIAMLREAAQKANIPLPDSKEVIDQNAKRQAQEASKPTPKPSLKTLAVMMALTS
jgi:hypothetical protein